MEALIWETAEELDQKLAKRLSQIRKRRKISQQKLADMSGVSYGSIKRFETTGQISLLSLTKIAMALDVADELRELFLNVPYQDIQEVINETRICNNSQNRRR
ncbi:MAG: XRE family transcriptional regulator [Pseudobutyrivibrio sp.]|nr:XRE family transcriptional regulator [Pseudobutyrivibrio sp.]